MKRVINGLLYDTEKSKLLYTEEETLRKLYMTKSMRFFTLYKNGEIIPKSEESAKEYLGARDIDKYIEIFGTPEEA